MSDDNHLPEGFGTGHEVDALPAGRLINLLVIFTGITVLSCIGLIQVFNGQRDDIGMDRAQQGSYLYNRYKDEMNEVAEGFGPTADGKFFVSHDKARELVLGDPNRLKAAPPPPGWIHPDDVQAGGAAAPPPPAEAPAEEAPAKEAPAEGTGEGADQQPADGAPAQEAPTPAPDRGAPAPAEKKQPKPAPEKAEPKPAKKEQPEPAPAKAEPKPAPKKADDAKGDGN